MDHHTSLDCLETVIWEGELRGKILLRSYLECWTKWGRRHTSCWSVGKNSVMLQDLGGIRTSCGLCASGETTTFWWCEWKNRGKIHFANGERFIEVQN